MFILFCLLCQNIQLDLTLPSIMEERTDLLSYLNKNQETYLRNVFQKYDKRQFKTVSSERKGKMR